MPFPRRQTLTPASLAARRRNAQKSTGPRTAKGKARVALNSIRHGVNSKNYHKNLIQSGEDTRQYASSALSLVALLHPRNRLQFLRLDRYANLLWTYRRRIRKLVTHSMRTIGPPLTRAEIDLQLRIMKDLARARMLATPEQRRYGASLQNHILRLGGQMSDYLQRQELLKLTAARAPQEKDGSCGSERMGKGEN
jgi:hypothetical protein